VAVYAQAVVDNPDDITVRTAPDGQYVIHTPGLFLMLSPAAAESGLDQLTALMFAAEADSRTDAALALVPAETQEQDR
jgi:hypothetical protein